MRTILRDLVRRDCGKLSRSMRGVLRDIVQQYFCGAVKIFVKDLRAIYNFRGMWDISCLNRRL